MRIMRATAEKQEKYRGPYVWFVQFQARPLRDGLKCPEIDDRATLTLRSALSMQ
ncbi:hypothetical protein [uncultured Roseobacter sp.]|uniref:hypothetical protein n=1 Tax=uncultured Roseobacter sp. TaxID=114847 RepID=UPI0026066E9F|nr:hypothetical protein [uncultured Roseobacter sp.]